MNTNQLLIASNSDYHADRTHLSSSSLKCLLKSSEEFYERYILGLDAVDNDKDHFIEGTLLHTLVLEPEKFTTDYAVYPGLKRYGRAFDEFKANNKGKKIINSTQNLRAQKWLSNTQETPVALEVLANGLAEHTMVGEIMGIKVKSRADKINLNKSYIVDVKTSSQITDAEVFKHTVGEYNYDLSASLYCEIARQTYGRLFEFYWVVVSKVDNGVAVYKASSRTLSTGASQVTAAIVKYKKCLEANNWSNTFNIKTIFSEEIIEI